MNFYHVYYKKQYYDKSKNVWVDTHYDHQSIIVIANNYEEAKLKIEKCLEKVEINERWRIVLVSNIIECIGLNISRGFEGSEILPIFNI